MKPGASSVKFIQRFAETWLNIKVQKTWSCMGRNLPFFIQIISVVFGTHFEIIKNSIDQKDLFRFLIIAIIYSKCLTNYILKRKLWHIRSRSRLPGSWPWVRFHASARYFSGAFFTGNIEVWNYHSHKTGRVGLLTWISGSMDLVKGGMQRKLSTIIFLRLIFWLF